MTTGIKFNFQGKGANHALTIYFKDVVENAQPLNMARGRGEKQRTQVQWREKKQEVLFQAE